MSIDTEAPSIPYSTRIFGGFLEHFDRQIYGGVFEPGSPLADANGFRADAIAALEELRVPVVRWPGGCFVSGYHWESGVGRGRTPTDDMAWGVVEPNTFGTDEFVDLCRLVGWLPYICTNAGNGTIEEMRNWVEYCNAPDGRYAQLRAANGHAQPRRVPVWSIGNENWGPHEIGCKAPRAWAAFVAEAAQAMKAVDPDIQLSAAALRFGWSTLPLLRAAGEHLDYVSIHSYWIRAWMVNFVPDYLTCIVNSDGPERILTRYLRVLDRSGYRGRVKIAWDEWNLRAWHHPWFPRKTVQRHGNPRTRKLIEARAKNDDNRQYTMADALFSASFFNACLRHADDVGMANIAPLVNTRGPLFVHPDGVVRRTHFHAMAMYTNELECRVGQAQIESDRLRHRSRSVAVVDAVATVNESGSQWSIALVNRHPWAPVACTLAMKGTVLEGEYAAVVLTGDSPEAHNDIAFPDRVVPIRTTVDFAAGKTLLPPHSLTIVKVSVQ